MKSASMSHWYGICERTSLSIYAEPLNVLSSFAFMFVAVAIFRQYRRHEDLHGKWIWDVRILTLITFIIGINSIVFHAFPSALTEKPAILYPMRRISSAACWSYMPVAPRYQ